MLTPWYLKGYCSRATAQLLQLKGYPLRGFLNSHIWRPLLSLQGSRKGCLFRLSHNKTWLPRLKLSPTLHPSPSHQQIQLLARALELWLASQGDHVEMPMSLT